VANRKNGAIYTGVTSDLVARIWQHREGLNPRLLTPSPVHATSLVRTPRRHAHGDRAGEATQGWIAPEEGCLDRKQQPALARPLPRYRALHPHQPTVIASRRRSNPSPSSAAGGWIASSLRSSQ
jgi:hypothetical protein